MGKSMHFEGTVKHSSLNTINVLKRTPSRFEQLLQNFQLKHSKNPDKDRYSCACFVVILVQMSCVRLSTL